MSEFELAALTNDVTTADGLKHAVLQSLHNWQRDNQQHGWWSDTGIGTKDWLLAREKQTEQTLKQAKRYTTQALQWLIDKGVAQDIDISCSFAGDKLQRVIEIRLANQQLYNFKL
jgi:phage gp46-like protein